MNNELLVKIIQGKENAKEELKQLYLNNLPLIKKTAQKYANFAEFEDLLQEGYIGLYEAAYHYNSDINVKFITYATYWIRQAMQRYVENCCRSIRIPAHLVADIAKYKQFLGEYIQYHNREPLDKEICHFLGYTPKKLKEIKKAYMKYNVNSLDAEFINDGGDSITLGETLAGDEDVENSFINAEMKKQMETNLWQIVQDSLTEQENEVITEKYQNNKTRQEIADIMEDNVAFIRSMEDKAMRKLRMPKIKRILEDRFDIAISKAYKGSIVSGNILYSSTERAVFKDMHIRI